MPPLPVAADRPRRHGLRPTSVPAILLGLGALCLLVAAVIFLAVAWSWLGVGGRTAVLVGLTVAVGRPRGRTGTARAARRRRGAEHGRARAARPRRARGRRRRLARRPHRHPDRARRRPRRARRLAWPGPGRSPAWSPRSSSRAVAFLTAWGAALDLSSASLPRRGALRGRGRRAGCLGARPWRRRPALDRPGDRRPGLAGARHRRAHLGARNVPPSSGCGRPTARPGPCWPRPPCSCSRSRSCTSTWSGSSSLASAISVMVGVVALPVVDEGLTSVTVVALVVAAPGGRRRHGRAAPLGGPAAAAGRRGCRALP